MKSVQWGSTIVKAVLACISVFIVLFSCKLQAGNQLGGKASPSKPEPLSKRIQQDSTLIRELVKQAHYQFDIMGDSRKSDSIADKAIMIANGSYHAGLLFYALSEYIENNDLASNNTKAVRYASQALELSLQLNNAALEWRALKNLSLVYLADYQYNKALTAAYKALSVAGSGTDPELRTESFLLIGRSLEGPNQKIEAFRNYLNAVAVAEASHNKSLLKRCYSQLSNFYNLSRIYDKASYYKLKEAAIIEAELPVDSLSLMWTYHDLQVIDVNSNDNRLHEDNMHTVLGFAIRHQYKRLLSYQLSLYRSHLIEANKIDELYKLYTRELSPEFARLQSAEPVMYLRLKAIFSEYQHNPDSALIYFKKAEQLISTDPNKIMKSNFYHRYAQFRVRNGNLKDAITLFVKSYESAASASYFDYMLDASDQLKSLYVRVGDYQNAYKFSELHHRLADSLNALSQSDQMLMLEIDHETKSREQKAALEHEETLRRHNIQYTAITIVIFAVFILLIMLGSVKVPSWVIKMLGFFSFILLFEFIIMIADHKIYEITHNEPWKILAIKIGLIAFLLPFHHWIEEKVIHYLLNHKLINFRKISVSSLFRRQDAKTVEVVNDEI